MNQSSSEKLEMFAQMHNLIMDEVNVRQIIMEIAGTEKGNFDLRIPSGGTAKDYRFYLNDDPVTDTTNNNLMNKIGVELIEKYFIQKNANSK